ncbi:glycosyltransferase [Microbacterium sp. NPDC055455]
MTAPVWAVFSAYRPDPSLIANVASVADQVAGVVVVDDGGGDGFDDVWSSLAADDVTVVRLPANAGIAAALNRGVAVARLAGARSVVTFDQDSSVAPGFVEALETTARSAAASGRPAAPVVPEFFGGVSQAVRRGRSSALTAPKAIQSGMLVEVEVFDAVGPLREDFFIDLVDVEFAMRCRVAGRTPLASAGLRLEHRLGLRLERRVLGILLPGAATVSTPFRYYYRVRNRVALNRIFAGRLRGARLIDTALDAAHFAMVLPLARPWRSLAALYLRGLSDGRRLRLGRIDPETETRALAVTWSARRLD